MSIARVKASSLTQGLPKQKTLLAGNSTILPGSYESIATVTVGAGGSSTISFSSIPSTYTHLQLRGIAKDNRAAANPSVLYMQLNGDTGSNYSQHYLVGDGSGVYAGGGSYTQIAVGDYVTGAAANAANFGSGVVDILDYSSTNKYKTVRSIGGIEFNGSGTVGLNSGSWRNTAAITSITLFSFGGTFVQYSSYALYGIK